MRAWIFGLMLFSVMFWDCSGLPLCLIQSDCANAGDICQQGRCVSFLAKESGGESSPASEKETRSEPGERVDIGKRENREEPDASVEVVRPDERRAPEPTPEPISELEPVPDLVSESVPEPDSADRGSVPAKKPHLYYVPSELWVYRIIPVCWINPDVAHAKERMWVRSAVEHSWEKYSFVVFTGWGTCPAMSKGIRISVGNQYPGVNGSFGNKVSGKSTGLFLDFRPSIQANHCALGTSHEDCIRLIARREFGHVLGFRYGYKHPQGLPDSQVRQCTAPQSGLGWVPFGDWDIDSVMNQCNPHFTKRQPGLSDADIVNVQKLYGLRWGRVGVGDVSNSRGLLSDGTKLYFVAKGALFQMGTSIGTRKQLGTDNWKDTVTMVHLGGFLYILQDGRLWKFDLAKSTRTQVGKRVYQDATAMATSGGKLYLIQSGILRALDLSTLQTTTLGSDRWPHARKMVAHKGALYINLNADIWKVDLTTGVRKKAAAGDWTNTKAMAFHGGALYIQANTQLYKVNLTTTLYTKLQGSWEDVHGLAGIGQELFLQNKTGLWRYSLPTGSLGTLDQGTPWTTTALGASDTHLFIVQGQNLWRVDPFSGQRTPLGSPTMTNQWDKASLITFDSMGKMLYIKQKSNIWKTNPVTGVRSLMFGNGAAVTAMTVLGNHLFLVDDGELKSVNLVTRAVTSINRKWVGTTSMVAIGSELFLLRRGTIHQVKPTTGVSIQVGSSQLTGATHFAAYGAILYVQNGGILWRLDTVTGKTNRVGPDDHFTNTNGMGVVAGELYIQFGVTMVKGRLR